MNDLNRGALWKNENKSKPTDPDFKGNFKDSKGQEYWCSGWKRGPDANPKAPALSFSLTLKQPKVEPQSPSAPAPQPGFDDFDDDILF